MEYVSRGEVVETVIMLHNSKNAREKKDFISVEASSIREYYNHIKRKELSRKKKELLSKVFLIIIISISSMLSLFCASPFEKIIIWLDGSFCKL